MTTLKSAGASCPKCREPNCAEYAQMNQPARWTCNDCGATGPLTGSLSIRPPSPASQSKGAGPKRMNRNLTRVA